MARSVDEAFSVLLPWLSPTDTETQAAASHRSSIDSCLKAAFGMTHFFRSGSFGFGTSVSGYSDVDYFAVVPEARLQRDSSLSLAEFSVALSKRFPNTGVKIDSPAVTVPFGSSLSERHEIIPACRTGTLSSGHDLYGIPNRAGAWMHASPDAHAGWIDAVNNRFSGKVKPLIRLLKAWKYYKSVPIRSFYLEIITANYALTQSTIIFKYDVRGALEYLNRTGLALANDPIGLSDPVYVCFSNELAEVQTKLASTLSQANSALESESNGRIAEAFSHWNSVFNGRFPAYY